MRRGYKINESLVNLSNECVRLTNGVKNTIGESDGFVFNDRHRTHSTNDDGHIVYKPMVSKMQSNDAGLVPLSMFGTSNLFMMIDGSSMELVWNKFQAEIDERIHALQFKDSLDFFRNRHANLYEILVSKQIDDTPMSLSANTTISTISNMYNARRILPTLSLVGTSILTKELNRFYEENSMKVSAEFSLLQIPRDSDYFEAYEDEDSEDEDDPNGYINQDLVKTNLTGILDYAIDPEDFYGIHVVPKDYDFLVIYYTPLLRNYRFCNMLSYNDMNRGFEVFVQIGRTGIWQRLTKKSFKHLSRIQQASVKYAKTDNPRFISNAVYTEEFSAESLKSIVRMSVLIALDLDYQSVVDRCSSGYPILNTYPKEENLSDKILVKTFESSSNRNCEYEALELSITQDESTATALLTQMELGIDRDYYGNLNSISNRMNNNFDLLNLIETMSKLQHSKSKRDKDLGW